MATTTVDTVARTIGHTTSISAVIQKIQNVHSKVQGTAWSLDSIQQSLALVNQEEGLQNYNPVIQQVDIITQAVTRLETCLQEQPNYQGNGELQSILDQLEQADKELQQRNHEARHLSFHNKLESLQGNDLALVIPRQRSQAGGGAVQIDEENIPAIGPDTLENVKAGHTPSGTRDTQIYNNKTLSNAKFMTGDIGMEHSQRVENRKTRINDNDFGHNARVVTGNIGGEAAKSFNTSFWH
ncbi:hypothetical protein TsFJ059_003520 [Trichoderma semiorbis]|uniref:Uncharacterized protein n=1 Tax=Trichoderma semiorbis TaxID=1491008 RepID=A0A9P8HJ59_9HYPO|nr:hypothetical protein TsFJ059_003520 [Trichoderma semiorbis]